jgi:hypothetical protein
MPHVNQTLLGEPRVGIHQWRIPFVDIAAVDVLATFFVAVVMARAQRPRGSVITWFGILWAIGIALHVWFGVDTPVVHRLRSLCKGHKKT